jgi:hypothetical protein
MDFTNLRNNYSDLEVLNTQDGVNQHFYNGMFLNDATVNKSVLDPYVSGYAFLFWIKLPVWVTDKFRFFQFLSSRNFKEFNGSSDMSLEMVNWGLGFSGNENETAGAIKMDNGFTLTFQEFSGSPLSSTYDYWVSGIRDPHTNIAVYPRRDNKPYAAKNHTGSLLYVVTRPDADGGDAETLQNGSYIEQAIYYTNVMPKKINKEYLNFSSGTVEGKTLTQEFTGTRHYGKNVIEYAKGYMAQNNWLVQNLTGTSSFGNSDGYYPTQEKFVTG